MLIDYERILDHADGRLPVGARFERSEQIEAFRKFMKLESERLRMRHRIGLGGEEIVAGRSYQVDLVVRRACQWVAAEFSPDAQTKLAECSLVALGGYGRGELAPFSDIDLMFLRSGSPSKTAVSFVEQVLRLLWDAGLTVGHSYRSIEECVGMARKDVHSRTALTEARLIVGREEDFARFLKKLQDDVFSNPKIRDAFLEALRRENAARHARFGGAVGLLEPNIKESAGGLRDLHSVLWMGHARYGCRRLDELRVAGHVTVDEYAAVRRSYSFVTRVRNQMHMLVGRKMDILSTDMQPRVAEALGYRAIGRHAASEVFMREYYKHAEALYRLCEAFVVRTMPSKRKRFSMKLQRKRRIGAFELRDGRLDFSRNHVEIEDAPRQMLELFDVAQEKDLVLSDAVKVELRRKVNTVSEACMRLDSWVAFFRSSDVSRSCRNTISIITTRSTSIHCVRLKRWTTSSRDETRSTPPSRRFSTRSRILFLCISERCCTTLARDGATIT
jgi:[protein-PII] uridylyltransferase